ncbi:hypothetical protein Syun_019159 [Stephania yunnanensis]|uniref:Uncharacterized protein n=1 Tax=Stephania yunnanensis TaxID=152371 RepID=A0AAP0ITK5_9MAGN
MGRVPGTNSITNSTCLGGGNPGRSSGKTFGNSRATGTSSSLVTGPSSDSTILARISIS